MEIKSRSNIKGFMRLRLYGPDGKLKQAIDKENTVTELMDAHTAYRVANTGANVIGYMAVGTGSGQTSASTGLAAGANYNALDSRTQGSAGADNDVVFVATWAPGDATMAITEAGVFQGNNNTTLMLYDDFDVVNKGATDTLVITWTCTFGAS
jgi:hypothetical protein